MSSPDKSGISKQLLSTETAATTQDSASNPQSRRPSSTGRPSIGDRGLSANALAALREDFEQYGSPPKIPNIPLRGTSNAVTTEESTPARVTSPETTGPQQTLDAASKALSSSPGRTTSYNNASAVAGPSGTSTPGQSTVAATSIDELTDAQKAVLVGRHLLDRQEQQKARKASNTGTQEQKESIKDMLKNVFKGKGSDKADNDDFEDQQRDDAAEAAILSGNPAEFPVSASPAQQCLVLSSSNDD
jgi:hypothetical protein